MEDLVSTPSEATPGPLGLDDSELDQLEDDLTNIEAAMELLEEDDFEGYESLVGRFPSPDELASDASRGLSEAT